MPKKIIAIGGGENGRIDEKGNILPYDTESIDKEIIKQTGKEKPNFLFINHAFSFSIEIQESYFQTMKKIYGDMFECDCKDLKSNELDDKKHVKELVEWADIIYEGGGDTHSMILLWKQTGFDKILKEAYIKGKVISGISAGAVCYFNSCNSDKENNEFEIVDCLNWFDLFITPHCNEKGRYESTKEQLKNTDKIGILMTNCAALEIINDKYRILLSKNNKKVYVIKAYWEDGKYKEKKLTNTEEFLTLSELYKKDI